MMHSGTPLKVDHLEQTAEEARATEFKRQIDENTLEVIRTYQERDYNALVALRARVAELEAEHDRLVLDATNARRVNRSAQIDKEFLLTFVSHPTVFQLIRHAI